MPSGNPVRRFRESLVSEKNVCPQEKSDTSSKQMRQTFQEKKSVFFRPQLCRLKKKAWLLNFKSTEMLTYLPTQTYDDSVLAETWNLQSYFAYAPICTYVHTCHKDTLKLAIMLCVCTNMYIHTWRMVTLKLAIMLCVCTNMYILDTHSYLETCNDTLRMKCTNIYVLSRVSVTKWLMHSRW
jgi:hypothetical protein